jgi:Domain of unknown function (DUF6867)
MLANLLGSSLQVFIGLTLVLFGLAAWMTGWAVGMNWKPRWHIWPYGLLLGAADRFLSYALFGAPLLAPVGFVIASLILIGIAAFAWRLAHVSKMVQQYPWIYERSGVLSYRERAGS